MSALLLATMILPSLGAAPVAASGSTTHFSVTDLVGAVTAGDSQSITVTALDAGDVVDTTFAGTVSFTSSDGAAVLPAGGASLTAGVGGFSVTFKTAGLQSVTVTEDGDTPTGSASTTVNPASATHFSVAGFTSPATAGVSDTFTVTALDAYGNTDTGYAGTVTFSSSDGAATLPANSTLTSGTDSFSATLRTAGSRSITATDGGLTGSQAGITVNPASATHFSVTGFTSPATAGVSDTFTVTALDAFDNVATGYLGTAHITSSDGAAVLPANHAFTGGEAGVHVFSATLNTVGTQSLTATDTLTPSITGSQSGIVVDPATATHFSVAGFTSPATAGVSDTFTVTALDAFDNVATGYTGTVHLTSTDGAAVLDGDHAFTGGEAGVHVFSATLKTAGSRSITATDGGLTGSQAGITVNPASATHFSVAGFTSPATAGVSDTFTVTALDAYGNTDTGYAGTVTFSSSDGAATLPANSTLTSGTDSFSATLRTAGSRSITATDGGLTGSQAGITVNPASATHFSVTGFTSPATAGVSDTFTVTALDAFDNVATGYLGTAHITSSDGAAVLPANHAFTGGEAGVHVFSATLNTVGTQSLTATDTLTPSITGSQSGIVVDPATATHFSVAGFTSPATAGVSDTFTVTALDAFDNVATGYTGTVHLTSTDGAAVLDGDHAFTGGEAGVHVFSATLKTAGSRSITATDGGLTGSQAGITVNPASATHFSVAGFTSPATAGVSDTFTVTALDAYGNTDTGYAGTVTFSSSDGAATLPANSTLTSGTDSFSATLRTAGSRSITATDGGLTGSQAGITVNPASATHFSVTGFTSPATAGVSDTFTVTALDAFDNVATGYLGTAHITSSDGAAVLPANHAFTGGEAGVHVFSATLNTVGTQSLTATDTLTPSITGSQSGIVVDPATATHFSVAGFTSPATAGVSDTFTVTALDAFDNVATGYTGTVHLTSTDGAAVLDGDHAFTGGEAGVHVFSATLKTAGSRSITATDGGLTGSQAGITVNPASATHFSVAGFTSPATAGVSDTFTVTALDAYGNTDTGYAGTVTFSSSDGAATLPANSTLTNGTELFSATLRTAGSRSITATDTLTPSITGTQAGITVNPAAATHFTVAGFTSPATAGAADGFSVTALDAYGNTATGYTGTVQFSSTDGAATLPGDYTFLVGDAGFQTFSATLRTVGSRSITATDTLTPSIAGSQSGIVVDPATATHFSVTGFTSPATAGVSDTFTVTALDAYGNTDTGYTGTVQFSSTDGAATLPANSTLTNGTDSFSATLKTAGSRSITATDTLTPSITGAQSGITVNPAAATHVAVTGFADPVTAGVQDSFVVTALDAFGNTATGYTGTVHITSTDAAAVLPADHAFIGPDGGVHVFNATLKTVGSHSITATDTLTPSITGAQAGIDVDPAAADHLVVSGFNDPTTAGVSHGITVTALDAFDNQATGYTGTVAFTSSDSAATLPGDYTFTGGDAGAHVFSGLVLRTVGSRSITVTDTTSSTITGAQAGIDVNPAAASQFLVVGYLSPAMSGVSDNVTVTALDAFDNVATGYLGTVHITSTDGAATLPVDHAYTGPEAGVHVFAVTLNTAGNQSITATDTVTGSITGAQVNIAVDPGPIDHIVISPSTMSTTAGVSQAYAAEGFDAADNDLGDFTSNTVFTIAVGSCVAGAPPTCSAVTVGDHTVTGTDSIDGTGPLVDTATLTITNTDPVASDETPAAILEDAAATTFDVLTNDVDLNLDTLTVTGVTQGAQGLVTFTAADVTYTPAADTNGTDLFTYTIGDGHGGSHTATVHVTITAVNDAPSFTIPSDPPAIAEQTGVAPQTVSGLATGMSAGPSDEQGSQNLSFTISNSAPTLFSTQPSVNVTTGDLTYTPAVNRNGIATVTLTLHDDGGVLDGGVNFVTHTFTITVTGSNHAPIAINDSVTVVQGSSNVALAVLANDNASNPDVGETLKIANVTQGIAGGKVTITGGGTGLTYRPKSGFHGTDYFTYRIKDATHTSGYATVRVSVPRDTYKPVAKAPVQTIAGQSVGTSTVVVHLTWSATDLGYGVARYELWRSVNGHSYTRVSLSSALARSANVSARTGYTYRFRVRAIDKRGNVGAFAYGPTVKVYRYQESSSAFAYTGAWGTKTSTAYDGGKSRQTVTATSDATFTGSGRTFAWVAARTSTRGTANVYVDGILSRSVSLTSSSTTYRYVAYSITFTSPGTHTFRIVYTGATSKRIDVDSFVVLR